MSSDIKDFMSKLLKEDAFDKFCVRKVEVTTIAKFEINGAINKAYLSGEEAGKRSFCTWNEIRPYVFGLIRGSKRPKSMKIVFSYNDDLLEGFHTNAKALFLNLTYEGDNMMLTTGTSQKNFSMDKSMDMLWDDFLKQFFKDKNIIVSAHL